MNSKKVQTILFSWCDRVNRAIDEHRIALVWHPIVPLDGRPSRIEFHEVCVRLMEDNPIAAEQFIRQVNVDPELSRKLDRSVIQMTCSGLRGRSNKVAAINLTAASAMDSTLPSFVADVVIRAEISPSQLVFEVTEHERIQIARVKQVLSQLIGLGCTIALDDFGKGYSGLEYVLLPAQYLKIDGAIVRQLGDRSIRHAAEMLCLLAQRQQWQVIAECIEYPWQERIIKRLSDQARVPIWGQGRLISASGLG